MHKKAEKKSTKKKKKKKKKIVLMILIMIMTFFFIVIMKILILQNHIQIKEQYDLSEISGIINLNIDDKSENYDKVNMAFSDKKS